MKHAQSATEYLVALGGLFIVVLLVLGSVYDIPSMLSSSTNLESQRYWASAEIGVLYAYANGSDTIFAIKNNQRESVVIDTLIIGTSNYTPSNLSSSPLLSGSTGIYKINSSKSGSFSLGINYTIPSLALTRYFDAGGREFGIQRVSGNLNVS